MRKALFLAVFVALMACGVAIAADKIGTMGAPNASGTYPIEAFDDRSIVVASDATFTVSNDLVVSDDLTVTGDLIVDTDIYASKGVIVDGSIYVATTDGGATGGAGLYLSQPDGGCSKCYVNAAGTTFACADITCPAGMN